MDENQRLDLGTWNPAIPWANVTLADINGQHFASILGEDPAAGTGLP